MDAVLNAATENHARLLRIPPQKDDSPLQALLYTGIDPAEDERIAVRLGQTGVEKRPEGGCAGDSGGRVCFSAGLPAIWVSGYQFFGGDDQFPILLDEAAKSVPQDGMRTEAYADLLPNTSYGTCLRPKMWFWSGSGREGNSTSVETGASPCRDPAWRYPVA